MTAPSNTAETAGRSPATPTNGGAAAGCPGFWRRPAGRLLKWVGALTLAVALTLTVYLYFFGVLGANFHEVQPGPRALYRSGQLSAESLADRVQAAGIRTVINLRGSNPGKEWYDSETAKLAQLQVHRIDIKMSGRRMPSRENLVLLIRSLKNAPRPALVHCESGADRSGLACALERLLERDGDFGAARAELAFLPYGHTGLFGYEAMDRVIDQFERYRNNGGQADLEQWASTEYDPGPNGGAEVTPKDGSN